MDLDKLPLSKIRIVQQDTQASRDAAQKTSSVLAKEKCELEQSLRKLNEILRTQGRDIQLLELAGNISHCFPGPHEELRKQIIAQRAEAARKDITVAKSEEAISKLDELITTLRRRCPHTLVFGHYDLQDGDYGPITPGHRICAFCGLEETKECVRFQTLNDNKDNLVLVYVGKANMDASRKDAKRGDTERIVRRHGEFKSMMKFLKNLTADE
jgi:hypothetical protein